MLAHAAANLWQWTMLPRTINAITKVWELILVEEVDKYVGQMLRVVQAVIDARGGHTRF
jgi:hypothetical protein